jgi:hypothetical protein
VKAFGSGTILQGKYRIFPKPKPFRRADNAKAGDKAILRHGDGSPHRPMPFAAPSLQPARRAVQINPKTPLATRDRTD